MLQERYTAACGGTVLVPSETADHLRAHPEVVEHLGEAIARVRLPEDGSVLRAAVDVGYVVGRSGLVKTVPIGLGDRTLFTLRTGRRRPSRVAVGVDDPETTSVVVIAGPSEEDGSAYELWTAFPGDSVSPREPCDQTLRDPADIAESRKFWTTHALIHKPEVMSDPFESSWAEVLGLSS